MSSGTKIVIKPKINASTLLRKYKLQQMGNKSSTVNQSLNCEEQLLEDAKPQFYGGSMADATMQNHTTWMKYRKDNGQKEGKEAAQSYLKTL